MNAFDESELSHNQKRNKMPTCNFVIVDSSTGLYLSSYSTTLSLCTWSSKVGDAVCFNTQALADGAITSWGETPGQRFIGQNPPPR